MKYVLLIAALLTGCYQAEPIVKKRSDTSFKMQIKEVSAEKMPEVCSALGVQYEADGCAAFDLDNKICTIYVTPPKNMDDTEGFKVVGHETWHCAFGPYHE